MFGIRRTQRTSVVRGLEVIGKRDSFAIRLALADGFEFFAPFGDQLVLVGKPFGDLGSRHGGVGRCGERAFWDTEMACRDASRHYYRQGGLSRG